MHPPKILAFSFFLAYSCFFRASQAQAQMLANPTTVAEQGRAVGGGGFTVSKIEYDFSRDRDVRRKILHGDVGFGLVHGMDLFGQVGFSFDSDIEDVDLDGKGFIIGFGPRFAVHQAGSLKVTAYGLLNFTMEEYEGESGTSDIECDVDVTDLHLGGMATFAANNAVKPYGGLEIILNSDGDSKCKVKVGSATASDKNDAERDDQLNLHAGANILAGGLIVRPGLILAGETTFTLGIQTFF